MKNLLYVVLLLFSIYSSVAQSPIISYNFDENTGVVLKNISSTNFNGLITSSQWDIGKYSNSIKFNGISSYVDIGNLDIIGNQLTISAWFKAEFLEDRRLISKASGVFEQDHIFMLSTFGDKLRVRLKTGNNTSTLIASSGNIILNTWHYATFVYDGSFMRLYLDGILVGNIAKTGNINSDSTLKVNIGRNPDGSNYWKGNIDNLIIYNRALSLTEILNDMNTPIVSVIPNYTLTLTTNGNGGITKNPNLSLYPSNTTVILTATATTNNVFTNWSGDIITNSNPVTIVMEKNNNIIGNFQVITNIPPANSIIIAWDDFINTEPDIFYRVYKALGITTNTINFTKLLETQLKTANIINITNAISLYTTAVNSAGLESDPSDFLIYVPVSPSNKKTKPPIINNIIIQ